MKYSPLFPAERADVTLSYHIVCMPNLKGTEQYAIFRDLNIIAYTEKGSFSCEEQAKDPVKCLRKT
jgi:hypothetical protein